MRHPRFASLAGDAINTATNRWTSLLAYFNRPDVAQGNGMSMNTLQRVYFQPIKDLAKEIEEIQTPAENNLKPQYQEENFSEDVALGTYQCDYVLAHIFSDNRQLGFDRESHGPGILNPALRVEGYLALQPNHLLNMKRKLATLFLDIVDNMSENHDDEPGLMGLDDWTDYGNMRADAVEQAAQQQLQQAGALNVPAGAPPDPIPNQGGRGVGAGRGRGRGHGRGADAGRGRGAAAGGAAAGRGGASGPLEVPVSIESTLNSFVTFMTTSETRQRDLADQNSAVALLLSADRLVVPLAEVVSQLTGFGIASDDAPSLLTGMIRGLSPEAKLGLAQCLKEGPSAFFRAAFGV